MTEDIIINKEGLNIVVRETKLKIGLGLSMRDSVSPEFVMMLLARLGNWANRYTIVPLIDLRIPIDLSRNKIVESAKRENCDYLFFIDSDVLIEEGQLERLLYHNKDIITGIYYQRIPPYSPLPRKRVSKNLYIPIEPDGQEIIDIDGVGMGCVLIRMNVFDRIHYPWFEFIYHREHGKWSQLSEDLSFCQKLQDVGIRIYCDPTIQCRHLGTDVSPNLSRVYKEFRISSADEREKVITELYEFTGISSENIYSKWETITESVADEYRQNPKDFYRINKNYIFDLVYQHMTKKRGLDVDIVKQIKERYPLTKKILDFGSGCGQNAIMLAEAGYDVAMADFDGFTYDFAKFRIKKRGLNVKFYDIEMPIDDKFDVILAFEVLDHVPDNKFETTIELLRMLRADSGEIMISTSFGGYEELYPMRYGTSPEKEKLIQKLIDENP